MKNKNNWFRTHDHELSLSATTIRAVITHTDAYLGKVGHERSTSSVTFFWVTNITRFASIQCIAKVGHGTFKYISTTYIVHTFIHHCTVLLRPFIYYISNHFLSEALFPRFDLLQIWIWWMFQSHETKWVSSMSRPKRYFLLLLFALTKYGITACLLP